MSAAATVRRARPGDLDDLVALRSKLYGGPAGGGIDAEEVVATERLVTDGDGPAGEIGDGACFVVERPHGGLCGFAEVSLRSHAEGCWEHTSGGRLGIAYLEGWWVDPDRRGAGAGRALIAACEEWARDQGSPALASDALLDNTSAHAAHRAVGFREVERAVHFVKPL